MNKLIVVLVALSLLSPVAALAGDVPAPHSVTPETAPTSAEERGASTAYVLGSVGFDPVGLGAGARGTAGLILHERLSMEAYVGTNSSIAHGTINSVGVGTRVFLGNSLNVGAGLSLHEMYSSLEFLNAYEAITGRQLTADVSFGLLWQFGNFNVGVDLFSISLPIADLGGHLTERYDGEIVNDMDLDEGGTRILKRYLHLQVGVVF
jgi:hypothetical protein